MSIRTEKEHCYFEGTKDAKNIENEGAYSPLLTSRCRVSDVQKGGVSQVCSRGQIIRVLYSMLRNLDFYHIVGRDSKNLIEQREKRFTF